MNCYYQHHQGKWTTEQQHLENNKPAHGFNSAIFYHTWVWWLILHVYYARSGFPLRAPETSFCFQSSGSCASACFFRCVFFLLLNVHRCRRALLYLCGRCGKQHRQTHGNRILSYIFLILYRHNAGCAKK